jgi:DNA topoisomerase IB
MTLTKLERKGDAVKVSTFNIGGDQVKFLGNINGSMDVKFNRVARIGSRYEEIVEDMEKIINKEGNKVPVSQQYTASVALLCIMSTGIRIGNEDSAEGYVSELKYKEDSFGKVVHTYGLTTILPQHVSIRNNQVNLNFVGKKQEDNSFVLNKELSKLVIPIINSKYTPVFNITEDELTSFIRKKTSPYFSAKDFRTFRANVYAYNKAKTMAKPTSKKEWKETVRAVCEYVSQYLNNTHQVVKTSYVDPMLWDYMFGPITQFDKDKTKKEFGGLLLI